MQKYVERLSKNYWERAVFALLDEKERKMGRIMTVDEHDQFIRQNEKEIERISDEMLADAGQEY